MRTAAHVESSREGRFADLGIGAHAPVQNERHAESSGAGPGGAGACDATGLVTSPENLSAAQLLERIRERRHLVLRVVGGSMGPWLVPGDLIVVQRIQHHKVRRGDVVVFLRGSLLIAHRVIKVLGAGASAGLSWKTKGDSAEQCDPPVLESELVGRVTFIERVGGSIRLRSPAWIAFGWMLAYLSPTSRFWYPAAHLFRRLRSPRRKDSARRPGAESRSGT